MEVLPNITSIRFTFVDWFSLYPATFVLQANYWQIKKDCVKRLVHRGFKPGRGVPAMEFIGRQRMIRICGLCRAASASAKEDLHQAAV
ncbi:hypothetical protein NA56DRAFT_190889 [Hyaloscypha hepaticicola]|uniref:Uncharacterized protein n=1 Tax=Hyaloscypha hepaticicola TaxID=2082293 RepID=A0A2J6Q160_9HELO|nr:hypothetical protein NA56DRAFT_190889 [Hyaloscypha hepaticicola]